MKTPATQLDIDNAFMELMSNKAIFSYYDVTKLLREYYTVAHSLVKDVGQPVMRNSDYYSIRYSSNLPNGSFYNIFAHKDISKQEAIKVYNPGFIPSLYVNNTSYYDDIFSANTPEFLLTQDKRLNLSTSKISSMGLSTSDFYLLDSVNNYSINNCNSDYCIYLVDRLSHPISSHFSVIKKYSIDKENRVRVKLKCATNAVKVSSCEEEVYNGYGLVKCIKISL